MALRPEQRPDWWLFDCGEGTQHQLLRAPVSLPRMSRVFISHLHGDHCFGLPGLLTTRGLQGATEPLTLFGPSGLRDYVEGVIRTTTTGAAVSIQIVPAEVVTSAGDTVAFQVRAFDANGRLLGMRDATWA